MQAETCYLIVNTLPEYYEIWSQHTPELITQSALPALSDNHGFALSYEGVDVWPVFKSAVMMKALSRANSDMSNALNTNSGSLNFRRLARRLKAAFGQSPREKETAKPQRLETLSVSKPQIDVLCLGHKAPLFMDNEHLHNPHFDFLRVALGVKGLQSHTLYYDIASDPVQPFAQSAQGVKDEIDRLAQPDKNKTPQERRIESALEDALRSAEISVFNTGLTATYFLNRLKTIAAIRRAFDKLFCDLPNLKFLFVTNYYSPACWGAMLAAKARNITVIDIQHGVQGPAHHAYSGLNHHHRNMVPDIFLNWELVSSEHIRAQIGQDRSVITGINTLRKKPANAVKPLYCNPKTVALFLQYNETEIWLARLRHHIPETIWLLVRHHPGAVSRGHTLSLPVNCEAVDDHDLSALFAEADLLVTGYSSSAIEAAAFGLPIIAYSPYAEMFLRPYLCEEKMQICSDEAEGLASAIKTALQRPKSAPSEPELTDTSVIIDRLLASMEN